MAEYNRSAFADQLADPRLRDALFALTQTEVGGQGPDAQQAFLETVLNRAGARGLPLVDTMSRYDPRTKTGYYPSLGNPAALSDDQRSHFGNLLTRVMAGSDITGGATGNASGTVGFAGGPQTAAFGGERFGIEGPDMGKRLPQFAAAGGLPMAYDNPAPAMPGLPVEITQGESVTPNQRVAGAFDALQGGVPAGATPPGVPGVSAIPPTATQTTGQLPMQQEGKGGVGNFLGDNWLTLLALGGGIANGGIGEGFTQAARIGALQANSRGRESDDIREYQFAKQQGYAGSFENWMTQKRAAGAPKSALNPIYDAEGNIYTLTNDGKLIKPQGSEGFKANKGVELKDAGTYWQPVDKITGAPVGQPIPKNVAAKEIEEKRGQAQGTAETTLVKTESDAERMIDRIDALKNHKGLDERTGFLLGRLPALTPGAQDVNFRIQELQGGAFLQAYNQLRGTGAISEIEGSKAEKSLARLQTAQSTEDFRRALDDFEGVVKTGLENQRRLAKGQFTPAPKAPVNNDPFGLR